MRRFTVIGGDKRSLMLANLLIDDGADIRIFGFDNVNEKLDEVRCTSVEDAFKGTDIIICPLPFTEDNIHLNTPLYKGEISIETVFSLVSDKQTLFGGNIPDTCYSLAENYDVLPIDYFKREEMQILNAIPTAEGAIQIAMDKMNITLFDSNAIVLGFGRIGKTIAKNIYGLGANTHVAARKYSDLAWIKSYGYSPIPFGALNDILPKMDVIFNTIPYLILKKEELSNIKTDAFIIDVASKPGGVDLKEAEELGINTITALGLPGKVAPVTAAKIIKETIYNIIQELEV